MTVEPSSRSHGAGEHAVWSDEFEIRPSELEATMRRAWQRARLVDDRTLFRGMTLNLVVATPMEHRREIEEAIDRLLLRHPTRAFVVLIDESVDTPTMRVHVRVLESRSSRQLVLERIEISAATRVHGLVRSIVLPSRLDDLPTLLFWHDDLRHLEMLRDLAGIADHVAFDTVTFCGDEIDAPRALLGERASLLDLAHFRLRPWRRALAEAFEKFQWQPRLGTEVEIRHRALTTARSASRLLARWLEERLGAVVRCVEEPGAIGCELQPIGLTLNNGDLAEVRLHHRYPDPHIDVELEVKGQRLHPFQLVASRGELGDLLAAAADRCS